MILKSELERMNVPFSTMELGEVEVTKDLSPTQQAELKTSLLKFGLELMEDKKSILIEKIKNIVVEMIHYSEEPPLVNFSAYLSEKFVWIDFFLKTIYRGLFNK